MFYLRNLRVRLQDRRNRLYRSSYQSYGAELKYFLDFLLDNPYIKTLLAKLESSAVVDFDQWEKEHVSHWQIQFPDSEEGRAKVCYGILMQCLTQEQGNPWLKWGHVFSSETKFDLMLRDLTESVVDPFVNYLHDQIDEASNVLYLIERFKLKVEWFRQEELHQRYEEDTSVGEKKLDQELRAALFEGGVDYPFSQPLSPSGMADIVALLGTTDPLVMEIKVFDPDRGRGISHLSQGFHQVLKYANDYNQPIGYLVIFNCADRSLVVESADKGNEDFAPRIVHASKTFFVIPIDVSPHTESASKEKPATRVVVTSSQLIGE